MSFNLERLYVQILVFLQQFLLNFLNNLICYVVNMCPSFRSAYSVDKRNLPKLSI